MSNRASVALLLVGLFWIDAADAQRAPQDAPAWFLSVREGQLTANIDGIPLRLVLEELARQVPLRLTLGHESRDHPVTADFRALALDEALARLLAGFSYAVIHDPAPDGVGSAATRPVVELLVIGKAPEGTFAGGGEGYAVTGHTGPGQAATQDATPEWTAVLQHPDKAVRLEALQRWAEQGAATPLNPLTHALVDPDESVRARAQALVERVWAAKAGAQAR